MIGRILLATAVLAAPATVHAGWDAGGGLESYHWKEYLQGSSATPTERGPRLSAFVNWTQDRDSGALFGWRARIYGGTVDYDTFEISTGNPVSTQTDYGGISSEGHLIFRHSMVTYRMDQVLGLGLDSWRRSIRNGGGRQIEDFSVLFMRAGIRMHRGATSPGFYGELGIKYPLAARENAHLTDYNSLAGFPYTSNPVISPKGRVSGYAEIGYRVNARFDIVGYYDSWRFDRSNNVVVYDTAGNSYNVWQPESHMDALGLKLLASF